jgi:hypothetical protein
MKPEPQVFFFTPENLSAMPEFETDCVKKENVCI